MDKKFDLNETLALITASAKIDEKVGFFFR